MLAAQPQNTTVCIVGGGPAGAMLGLLLARAGIEVVLLEKHADFLRDFRGDTVHPSTIEVLDELGLADRFLALPHRKVSTLSFAQGEQRQVVADFRNLGLRYPYIAFVPQWDFLNLITQEASRSPHFRLLMQTEAYDVLREGKRTTGVRYRAAGGEHTLRAHLTVAADGRHSALRRAMGLAPRAFGAPMDVVMFKLPRRESDPDQGFNLRPDGGRFAVVIDRGSYWNIAYVIRKGGYEVLCKRGVQALRDDVASLVPFLADRTHELSSLDETRFLEVRLDRMLRWFAPGILFIGDAAHAMSPIGGVGVNLAVQDAVAAANRLIAPLRTAQRHGEPVPESALASIQRRRWLPTVATQTFQRLAQHFGVERMLSDGTGQRTRPAPLGNPLVKSRLFRQLLSRMLGVGFLPEHVRSS